MNEEMKNNDETLEALRQIQLDIGHAGRNLSRIGAQWRNGKFLDPAKIEAVTISLNRASSLLRDKIKPQIDDEVIY